MKQFKQKPLRIFKAELIEEARCLDAERQQLEDFIDIIDEAEKRGFK